MDSSKKSADKKMKTPHDVNPGFLTDLAKTRRIDCAKARSKEDRRIWQERDRLFVENVRLKARLKQIEEG